MTHPRPQLDPFGAENRVRVAELRRLAESDIDALTSQVWRMGRIRLRESLILALATEVWTDAEKAALATY